jgi:2-polyprenyl-6-methoxyphenol hydroxylase-like FAD-dependent oxidoreductase
MATARRLGRGCGRSGSRGGAIGARRPDGRWIFRPRGDPVGRRFGYPVYSLPRTDLLAALAGQLPAEAIRFDAEVTGIDAGGPGRRARVETADGSSYEADLAVAADGGRSAVRRMLFPEHPGPADGGYTIWWMLAPGLDGGEEVTASETLGRGAVWGTWAMPDGRIYAYATVLKKMMPGAGARGRSDDPLTGLREHFAGWYPQIQTILRAVDPASVYRDDARWMKTPLPAYHVGRVALLGDAAHPMTPDLGQGGSQAIEDAVVLGKLAGGDDRGGGAATKDGALFEALAAYTAARLPRTMDIVKRSMRMSAFHHATSPLAVALRDQVLKVSNSERTVGLLLRTFDPVFGWRP